MPPLEYAQPAGPALSRPNRSSCATTAGARSRNRSGVSPPPSPPDATEYANKPWDGLDTASDLWRITPKLHASLASEILSLRRELESTCHLVEDLKTKLAIVKNENENLTQQLFASAREALNAKHQTQQLQNSMYEALEAVVMESDAQNATAEWIKRELDAIRKQSRRQDDDAERRPWIWKRVNDKWETSGGSLSGEQTSPSLCSGPLSMR